MTQEKPSARRLRRLQIRVSVDEHMQELFTRLQGVPSPLRGRELVALARVACGLNGVSAAFAALLPSEGLSSVPRQAVLAGWQGLAVTSHTASTPSPEGLSEQAARRATATFDSAFLMAVPPPD